MHSIDYVSNTEKERVMLLIEEMTQHTIVNNSWLAGGCLLRADSKDIDVLIHAKWDGDIYGTFVNNDVDTKWGTKTRTTFEDDGPLMHAIDKIPWVKSCEAFLNYEKEVADNGKDIIIKVEVKDGRDIDLLIGSSSFRGRTGRNTNPAAACKTIGDYMEEYFPISMQCIASPAPYNSIETSEVYDLSVRTGLITFVKGLDMDSTYLAKYKKYYPGYRFIQDMYDY